MNSATDVGVTAGESSQTDQENSGPLEEFSYDDAIVRMFATATIVWGIVGMLVGLIVAVLLVLPKMLYFENSDFITSMMTFGRLRPLHTNAVIFAFAGNAIFTAVYYSTPRLLKTPMWSPLLSRLHFWGWQAIILAAAITLPLGITQSKEYAELEWPIDIAIAVVWLLIFGGNFLMTLLTRRERHMYVALWFYIATIVTVAMLHVFNNLVLPVGLFKGYSMYAGVQDAFMQWWYGHNAVAFFLTTPFLGMMYYFLPKAAERPIYSYKLSIVHFWSLVFIYIWAGPHHLHYTALPEWASTFGMVFSVMLWMPSWGGMINGLLTLRGAWRKVTADPVLKFFVVAITFYGMSTFEGPLLSVKAVNILSHYTDWTVAHVHAGALGWVGFMTFGMLYWLAPRIFQTKLYSTRLAEWHFWIGTAGILLYIVPIYVAGLTQGLMWRAITDTGQLAYPEFIETVHVLEPLYWIRVGGGLLYFAGACMLAVNFAATWATRPLKYEVPVYSAPALSPNYVEPKPPESTIEPVVDIGRKFDNWGKLNWHRRWEGLPVLFTFWVIVAVAVASLFEIIPTFLIRSNVPTIATVKPYTPLELAGRDIYISEGCYNCHSQMIRPLLAETKRYGEFSKPGEFVYDRPFQWGSRRIGPDLAREGGKQSNFWHLMHFNDPQTSTPGSIMPSYAPLLDAPLDFGSIQKSINAVAALGAPYDRALTEAEAMAREQAAELNQSIIDQGGNGLYADKQVIALIAYLQRLGTDLFAPPPGTPVEVEVEVEEEVAPAEEAEPVATEESPSSSSQGASGD